LMPMLLAAPLFGMAEERRALTLRERHKLASVATKMQLPRGYIIYREDDLSESLYIVGGGVVVSYVDLPSGQRRVAGFRFKTDIFGLAKRGRYVNTTRTVTPATVFRIPVETLTEILRLDGELEFQFLCKVVDDLRRAQRKNIIVARRDAAGRIAMFLELVRESAVDAPKGNRIELPMTRSDIGAFLNLTTETVSRACRRLKEEGTVEFDRTGAQIINRRRFDELVARI
jgi:CRP/FNR family transcriptional regulator, anaerobic regulatory protein